MQKIYTTDKLIPFDLCDPAGIVFFGNYFQIFHQCLENFCHSSSFGWEEWFQSQSHAVPIASAEASYKRPLWAGQIYELQLFCKSIGRSSVEFEFQIWEKPILENPQLKKTEENKLCATLHTKHVFVDKTSFKPFSIPANIRQGLESANILI